MSEEAKFLEIARALSRREAADTISKSLGVSGHEIAKTRSMIENGIITFNENGEPYFTVPYAKLKAILSGRGRKRMLTPEELSKLTVVETHQEALAKEARDQTDAYLVLGRAVFQAFLAWAVKHGYTLEDVRNMPIHRIVTEALDKADELDRLKPEYEALKRELEYYRSEVDPITRLRKMNKQLPEILVTLWLLQEAGANVDSLADFFSRTISSYITGQPYAR